MNLPETIREALSRASSFLSKNSIEDSAFIAELIIRSLMNWDRTQFVIHLSDPLPREKWQQIEQALMRRVKGEPVQYIIGTMEFFGETFEVGPGVLIPRPETEILVEHVLREGDRIFGAIRNPKDSVRVIDLGTGSGIIALTLAKQRPHWEVWALDYSLEALAIAKQNAERFGVKNRVQFIHGTMLEIQASIQQSTVALNDSTDSAEDVSRFDIIVSNPPYIPTAEIEGLDVQVKDYEPYAALDGGEDGLDFYRGIARQVPEVLNTPGLVALEIGQGQSREIRDLFERAGMKTIAIPDFRGIERVILGYR